MITPILDKRSEELLEGKQEDELHIFTLENDSIRGIFSSNTRMISQMKSSHRLGILETMVLGKAYIASSLLSATIKGDDKIIMKVVGDGPAKGFSVECSADGKVRGRLFVDAIPLDKTPDSLDTAPLIGHGTISLSRLMSGSTEAITGNAELRSGRLAEDLAWYYHISEQTRTSFTIGLHFSKDGYVDGAGGLLLQALPDAKDDALDRVERLVLGIDSIGQKLAEGLSICDICMRTFPFFDYNILDNKPTSFYCSCSKERLAGYIGALSDEEKKDILQNGPFPLQITCHNCGSIYEYSKAELEAIISRCSCK